MLPTATHSFVVDDLAVGEKYSFHYETVYLPQPVYKIPFSTFADLTLWVNYIGMAEHYLEEAKLVLDEKKLKPLASAVNRSNRAAFNFAEEINNSIKKGSDIHEPYQQKVHEKAVESVRQFSQAILEIYPFLGIKASRSDHQLNQIFRDYFTATQHYIFVNK
jgi:hypothetical protein